MLLEQIKNKKDEERIKNLWIRFTYKNGHKNITIDNFLDLDYVYCKYKIDKRYYQGYFTDKEVDFIFEVLDYHKGKILGLAG